MSEKSEAPTHPTAERARRPWNWIPSLYLAEGLPYVVVNSASVVMFKRFGLSNTEIAFFTSWLYLPWMIKPLWAPLVELLGTRRGWILAMQLIIGAGLAGIALTAPLPQGVQYAMSLFWLIAFASATHDIAADGFYLIAADETQQKFFVGVRTMFYRIATIAGQGLIVMLAGRLETTTGDVRHAWAWSMAALAGAFLLFSLWHTLALPRPGTDRRGSLQEAGGLVRQFVASFGSFFTKPGIGVILAFLLLYRLGEAQLVKMVSPFLLDGREAGGLGLSTEQVGFMYGTVGIIALTLGGIVGGIVTSRDGLRRWLWPMLFAIHLPDAVFIWLAYAQPSSPWLIQLGIALEQFGYGFGFTAYVLYMMQVARGPYQTAHYAIGTGLMAAGMMFPGMWSGWLEDHIGYRHFFTWVLVATIPSFLVARHVRLEDDAKRA